MNLLRRVALGCLFAGVLPLAAFFLFSAIFPLPPVKPYSLVIDDRNGRLLHAYLAADGAWRLRTPPTEIPDRLKKILIQREDRWFYYHPGVNPVSLLRALLQNMRGGRRVSGASTLTMQVARMLEPKERTYTNKLVEIFRALQLEWTYSKSELLEMYLSIVPLGGNIEGLKSAALLYYQTPVERLNIAQLFDLMLIPSNPAALQPDRFPDRLLAERKRQAARWLADGLLTERDSAIIWNTPAAAHRGSIAALAPHFCLRVREKSKGASEVQSSLDLSIQQKVEILLSNHLRPWRLKGVRNGAVIVLNNATREIVAYAGSGGFDDTESQGQVDAAKALRSPGSTLKPLLYALQMDRGELTPRTRLLDTPYDAEGFLAENYDGTYSGLVFADDALRRSLNVPMIRLLKKAGLASFVEFLGEAGIVSLASQQNNLGLSLILGGCGVTLEEMTGAYAAFPSGGLFIPPRFVRTDKSSLPPGKEIFSPATAWMITEILSGVDRPDLPNNFESSVNLPTVAFKTGTSYGRRDAWSIGYSAEYTIGVWIGNVTQAGSPDLVGSKSAAPLLFDIFNSISSHHQKSILPAPKDLNIRQVCSASGFAPGPHCSHLIEDYYSSAHTSNRVCEVCRDYMVSPDETIAYCPSCLADNPYKLVVREEYPAELLSYWQTTGRSFPRVPLHNPRCTRMYTGDGPAILSPSADMTYFFFSRSQKLTLQASSGLDVRRHVWYLDDRYLGQEKAGEKLFTSLSEGDHTISCLDDRGRMSSVKIKIRYVL